MPNSPQVNVDKLLRIRDAWRQFAPDKSFGGMTLPQYEAKIAPSLDSRTKIDDLERELAAEQLNRDKSDLLSMPLATLVVNGVKGDAEEGPNSDLWKAMGYVPDDERKSGLTRKKAEPPK